MDVILGLRREVEVDDVRDALDVDAACGDVGRHEHAHRAGLEGLQRGEALVLAAVRVQRGSVDAGRSSLRAILSAPCFVREKTSTESIV